MRNILSAATLGVLLLTAAAHAAPAGPAAANGLLDNCGVEVALGHVPRRVVTIKSSATEMLLALGLGERIVGQAFQDGPPPAEWAEAGARVPVISDRLPSEEALLGLAPDFVYAGWESTVSADGVGTRDALKRFGIASYVSPSACREPAYRPAHLKFEDVFGEIAEVGRLFGAEDRAAALIATQRAMLGAVRPTGRGQTALWYSSGKDVPYVGAGSGAPQMIMEALGLSNIAGGIADSWTSLSWEAVVAADPDVIVLVDASWNSSAAKIARLESNPATASLRAVRARRYLVIAFPASEAGVRNVPATAALAAQLAALGPPP